MLVLPGCVLSRSCCPVRRDSWWSSGTGQTHHGPPHPAVQPGSAGPMTPSGPAQVGARVALSGPGGHGALGLEGTKCCSRTMEEWG